MYVPMCNRPIPAVVSWLRSFSPDGDLLDGFCQKTLKEWLDVNANGLKFSVIQHPLVRVYTAFWDHILLENDNSFPRFRNRLEKDYGVLLPKTQNDLTSFSTDDIRHLFRTFLVYVKANLQGQTPLRVDASWATQDAFCGSFSGLTLPRFILKEDELPTRLPQLAQMVGIDTVQNYTATISDVVIQLCDIVDSDIQDKIRAIYNRDFVSFGFCDWAP